LNDPTTELKDIKRSLDKKADLPPVPDLTKHVRTLEVVKDELKTAQDLTENLSKMTAYLSEALPKLNSALKRLEFQEQELVDLLIQKLKG
jgi:hypothetical protein